MSRKRFDPEKFLAAQHAWETETATASDIAFLVRALLHDFSLRYPGKTVELRVPPYGAIQCIPGTTHTRGTPPNVVEMSPETFLCLAVGRNSWDELIGEGKISASGVYSNLSQFFPLPQNYTEDSVRGKPQ